MVELSCRKPAELDLEYAAGALRVCAGHGQGSGRIAGLEGAVVREVPGDRAGALQRATLDVGQRRGEVAVDPGRPPRLRVVGRARTDAQLAGRTDCQAAVVNERTGGRQVPP